MFLFKEIEGLDFELSSKDKKAGLKLTKSMGANSIIFGLSTKLDDNVTFADLDGIKGDVEGSLKYVYVWGKDIEFLANTQLGIKQESYSKLPKITNRCPTTIINNDIISNFNFVNSNNVKV